MARAAILARCGGVTVDDPAHPTTAAIPVLTPAGSSLHLAGDADSPALATTVRSLTGPVTLHATAAIAMRLPEWRPDASPRTDLTLTLPPTASDAIFVALPPGGVRRLRPYDARSLAGLPAWLWGIWETPEAMLRAAPAYARYLRGELVSLSCVAGETERYAAITAYTIERTRRNGFARECAERLIAAVISERGKQPVLTTAAANDAAIGLARSLGLTVQTESLGYTLP
jgi:ribosomal protein S18 acetylase RimI-like enzyme